MIYIGNGTTLDQLTVGDLLLEYITYAEEKLENAKDIRWVLEAHPLKHPIAKLKTNALKSADLGRYRRTGLRLGFKKARATAKFRMCARHCGER